MKNCKILKSLFSSIWPRDRNVLKYYHSGAEWTSKRWEWKGTPYSPKLLHYWSFTIKLFSVISRTLIGKGILLLCWVAVGAFLSPRRLGKCMHVYIYAYAHVYIHTHRHIYINLYIFIYPEKLIYTCIHIYIYIYIYIYNVCVCVCVHAHVPILKHMSWSSSSSSCRAASTDIPDPLSPLLPIIHRIWQFFRATSRILT